MTTYYIRTGGNNASAGTSAATAWATFGKALGASGIASGDTVYVGGGSYRETLTVAMTSATVETKIIGDIDGHQTGDAGEVILTAYTTNDSTAPSTSTLIDLADRDFLTFENITFVGGRTGGSAQCIQAYSGGSVTNITFRNCVFLPSGTSKEMIAILTTVAAHWLIERCVFVLAGTPVLYVDLYTNSTADYDADIVIRNCLIIGAGNQIVFVDASGGLSKKGGGILFRNNLCMTGGTSIYMNTSNTATAIPCKVENSTIFSGAQVAIVAGTSGQITEDYNLIHATTARTNVTAGTHSITDASKATLLEVGQAWLNNHLPRPFGMPMASSPLSGAGNNAVAPSTDMLSFTRPNPPSIGPLERNTVAQKIRTDRGMDGGMRG